MKHVRTKLKEKEGECKLLQFDVANMRAMNATLELKNTNLNERLDNVTSRKNVSLLDNKALFSKADKKLAKGRLINEINEAILALNKDGGLTSTGQVEKKSTLVGTNLKNIKRGVCY